MLQQAYDEYSKAFNELSASVEEYAAVANDTKRKTWVKDEAAARKKVKDKLGAAKPKLDKLKTELDKARSKTDDATKKKVNFIDNTLKLTKPIFDKAEKITEVI